MKTGTVKQYTENVIKSAERELSEILGYDVKLSYVPIYDEEKTKIVEEKVRYAVCKVHGISWDDISSGERTKEIVFARQMYCFFMNRFTPISSNAIANRINRERTTVNYSISAIQGYIDIKDELAMPFVNQIMNIIKQ